MPYPEELVSPMREELTSLGFKELYTAEEVQQELDNQEGTTLLVVNSVCGCAAGNARPGVQQAVDHSKTPDNLLTVFAGQENEATNKAREYTVPYPPSSPSIALFKDGQLVDFIERHHIEGKPAEAIAQHLKAQFDEHC